MTHNGWSNYETWLVSLWVNDSYCQMMQEDEYNYDKFELADIIKSDIEELNPLCNKEASVFTDLLNASISSVNFVEIAENILERV